MIILFSLLMALQFPVQAASLDQNCFDFESKVVSTLQPMPAQFEAGKDVSESRPDPQKDSASISGVVAKPLLEIYKKLLDPKTIRNNSNTEIQLKQIPSKNYLNRFVQSIKINATFFLTLRWDEEWVFALKQGTLENPKNLVISFQKIDGTSHIKRFCGNIALQAITPQSTGVFIYQEMKADQRTAKDLLNDITGTLRTLRDPI